MRKKVGSDSFGFFLGTIGNLNSNFLFFFNHLWTKYLTLKITRNLIFAESEYLNIN